MENIKFQIKEPKRNANGKILTIIAEFCKNWVLFRRKADLEYLLIEPLSEKGYTVKYSVIPFSFRIPVDYSIFIVKDGEKIKVFSNREEDKEKGIIVGFDLNNDNAKELIKKIIEWLLNKKKTQKILICEYIKIKFK